MEFFSNFHDVFFVAGIEHVVDLAGCVNEELFPFMDAAVAGVGEKSQDREL